MQQITKMLLTYNWHLFHSSTPTANAQITRKSKWSQKHSCIQCIYYLLNAYICLKAKTLEERFTNTVKQRYLQCFSQMKYKGFCNSRRREKTFIITNPWSLQVLHKLNDIHSLLNGILKSFSDTRFLLMQAHILKVFFTVE